jgi:ribosomal protein S18 acetylase RimI-like enzyme
MLMLRIGGEPAGCVAVPAAGDGAELKRLYLAPAHRGRGLGRQLACAAIDAARAAGHRTLRLDTLATMAAAAGLYRALGFREVSPPGPPPVGGMRYFELPLESA